MNIKIRFKPGDIVYKLDVNALIKVKVSKVEVIVKQQNDEYITEAFYTLVGIDDDRCVAVNVKEPALFASKEEIIEYINELS